MILTNKLKKWKITLSTSNKSGALLLSRICSILLTDWGDEPAGSSFTITASISVLSVSTGCLETAGWGGSGGKSSIVKLALSGGVVGNSVSDFILIVTGFFPLGGLGALSSSFEVLRDLTGV